MAKKLKPGDPGYWKWRGRCGFRGNPKAFSGPQQLWKLACEYFERIDSRPFLKQEQRRGQIKIDRGVELSREDLEDLKNPVVHLKNIRPYTWAGFTDYLNECGYITTLQDYKQNRENRYNDYVEVIAAINEVMWQQKFEGAASGAFNPSIIARDLGLAEKSEVKVQEEQPLFGDDETQE